MKRNGKKGGSTPKKKKGNRFVNQLVSILKWVLRSVMVMLTLLMCLLLLAAAYSDYIDPTWWVVPSFLGIAYLGVLVLALLWAIILLVTRRWHCLMVLGITALLVLGPTLRLFPLHPFGPKKVLTDKWEGKVIEQIDTIRVMSFNTCIMGQTHLSRIKEKIPVIDVIRDSEADIVCLQEYGFTLSKGGHTQEQLRGELKKQYAHYDYTPNDKRKALGIAIYSKYPIVKAQRVDTRKKGYFAAMYYQLDVNGRRVGLVNMHLKSNQIKIKDRLLYEEMMGHFEADSLNSIRQGMMHSLADAFRKRAVEAKMLHQFIAENHPSDMPLLICGDMNDTPISYCHHTLTLGGLQDTWAETGNGLGITYREHRFWFRIDHMFHNKYLRALHSRVRRDVTYSDHYPIEATFQLLPK